MNVVWILGAGFSKPLGGPLLTDLFSQRLTNELLAHFRAVAPEVARDLEVADNVYRGRGNRESVKLRGLPWGNPEQFLELLDIGCCADARSETRAIVARKIAAATSQTEAKAEGNLTRYSAVTRRYFAAAASLFLEGQSLASERWSPYRAWAKQLRPNDTVLTFNYDEVPERLADETSMLRVVLPHEAALAAEGTDTGGRALILKLHGSVIWSRPRAGPGDANVVEVFDSWMDALRAPADPLIATPGPGKVGVGRGLLAPLWDLACKRIRAADVIVFVGYRFPETDNEAKQRLLDAIRSRDSDRPLTAHLVLGADVNATDPRRLGGLLRWALSHYTLVEPGTALTPDARVRANHPNEPPGTAAYHVLLNKEHSEARRPAHRAMIWPQPLYAEDFLQVFDRRRLNAWHGYGNSMEAVVDS